MAILPQSIIKILFWIVKKPILTQDELNELHVKVNEIRCLNYSIACFSWVFSSMFFVSVEVYLCCFFIGDLFNHNNSIFKLAGILFILINIFVGFFISSLVWYFIMRKMNFINDATLELIIRNGPFLRKAIKGSRIN
jgi:hypothetical protein